MMFTELIKSGCNIITFNEVYYVILFVIKISLYRLITQHRWEGGGRSGNTR